MALKDKVLAEAKVKAAQKACLPQAEHTHRVEVIDGRARYIRKDR